MIKLKDILNEGKLNERLHVVDERYVGKYIIWVLQDGNKIRTAVMGKKGFDNFSSNDPDDLKKLWNLTKKFKGKPIPDIATEGKLTEAVGQYAVNVQDTRKNKQIQSGHFTLKADANLYIKDMMKKHKLKRQKGFWGNPKTGVEMLTNF